MSAPVPRSAAAPAAREPWRDPAAQPFVRIEGVTKTFGKVYACDDISLDVYRGEFFALLGGSGSGKSTLLRVLAGFESPDRGRVLIDGIDVTDLPPYQRPVNMMFQSYALFPHMSVAQNIAFGLKHSSSSADKLGAGEIRDRVQAMLELVRMPQLGNRKPDQLSGGQRQRVALARALAKQPKLLLLDEPLGALDKKLREHTQFELVSIQERVGTTFIMVTHDQEEAMTMSSRIAVMDTGRIVQVSTPAVLYEYPSTRFVAEFIGGINLLDGRVLSHDESTGLLRIQCDGVGEELLARHPDPLPEGTAVGIAVRPEKIDVHETRPEGMENAVAGKVRDIAYLGDVSIYHVQTEAGATLRVQETHVARSSEPHYDWDDTLWLSWDAGSAVVLTS
ncbi:MULTISPECIES: ABC transporter ATP-binding protein [Lysobacter]|uniref:Spermidine/putrescine import ATP-binding protein PotA n=1 Tax=Lysobacter gummosus TaxID=262324 RepID=A0ABY3XJE5_9GAMM|nr:MULTISPECIES: ABC transporter ATP-binding protein [Lysobacter]ALN91364.1 polyamine ABC transporter, ATP-binding family protein [Lysobacter gummosus]UJB21575.1 ABC transporter ATP-binding protein [Lysobacter capsici]UJQ29308.1 ABC transporter ATP-binding protein [Lysobacter gummosus]UNP31746.1 ABC transporter ATP-binding protein [Lysobacter gummosus]